MLQLGPHYPAASNLQVIFRLAAASQARCRPPAPLTTSTHTPLHRQQTPLPEPPSSNAPTGHASLQEAFPVLVTWEQGARTRPIPTTGLWAQRGGRNGAANRRMLQAPMAGGVQDPQGHSSAPQGVSASWYLLHRVHLPAQSLLSTRCTACPGHEQSHPVVQGSVALMEAASAATGRGDTKDQV